jgi:hypothetical protein
LRHIGKFATGAVYAALGVYTLSPGHIFLVPFRRIIPFPWMSQITYRRCEEVV